MFKELDPLLHSQLRLAIMSLLISVAHAEFTFLQEETGATSGNLSVQLSKLEDAGYIQITKAFSGKRPQTTCEVTAKGRTAFYDYLQALKTYIPGANQF